MSFFSRPNLEDLQFKQTVGSELSLSGQTRIRTWSGLTISDGSGADVIVNASGATDGYVLTYFDGLISLRPSSASGGTTIFDTNRITTRSGIPAVCVGGENTINNFLEGYFFPSVGPNSSISIASGGASREFGDTNVGNLSYNATRETNPICFVGLDTNADNIYDNFPVTTEIPADCSGSASYTYPFICATPPTGTLSTSVSFRVCVEDTTGDASSSSASITWRNRKFIIKTSTLYTDDSITSILTGGELSTTRNKTLNNENFSDQFFYYVYPKSFGVGNYSVNGLPNNAWGNSATGTLYEISYTNSKGYVNQYYVSRSDSRITGTFNINIT